MKVRIYKPTRSAMQSAMGKTQSWILEYEPLSKRTPDPLMGWPQADDTLGQIRLKFPSQEAAMAHAESQGWEYSVGVVKAKKVRPRNYMDNFRYIPDADEKEA